MAETQIQDEVIPTLDERTEAARDKDARIAASKAKRFAYQVPWPEGVTINGTHYAGVVHVDAATRDHIAILCNQRARAEHLSMFGDGKSGIHQLTGMHNLGNY
ncbi:MAG: hypothetical protein ACRDQZ_26290 [Mycobacteriales bacterium]